MAKTDRCVVRNEAYRIGSIGIRERHNERKNQGYSNPDIIQNRSHLNVYFKTCEGGYSETFDRMVESGAISLRGLKADAKVFDELVFDVNSAYFENHGGYEYAKEFFAEAYRAAVKEAGGEEYILSAVMHADERNRALSDQHGRDVFHYHLHVVYVPVVDKEIKWTKRCKDPALVGTVKEVVKQVSHSKKWPKIKQLDEHGNPVLSGNGKAVLINSYSLLQDRFFEHMRAAGFTDFERGERGSTAEHLSVLDYKIQQDEAHAAALDKQAGQKEIQLAKLDKRLAVSKQTAATYSEIDSMARKTIGGNVQLSPADWKQVSDLAKDGVVAKSDVRDLKKQLSEANKEIRGLKDAFNRLFEETQIFRNALAAEPKRVTKFLRDAIQQSREQREVARSAKKRDKNDER